MQTFHDIRKLISLNCLKDILIRWGRDWGWNRLVLARFSDFISKCFAFLWKSMQMKESNNLRFNSLAITGKYTIVANHDTWRHKRFQTTSHKGRFWSQKSCWYYLIRLRCTTPWKQRVLLCFLCGHCADLKRFQRVFWDFNYIRRDWNSTEMQIKLALKLLSDLAQYWQRSRLTVDSSKLRIFSLSEEFSSVSSWIFYQKLTTK